MPFTLLPVSSHSLPYPSNTTKYLHYLIFLFSIPFLYLLILLSFQSHYPLSHLFLLSPFCLYLLILSLILPIQLRLSIISCFSFLHHLPIIHYLIFLSSLTLCLYLLILSLILSNTTKIIHYLIPLFSHLFLFFSFSLSFQYYPLSTIKIIHYLISLPSPLFCIFSFSPLSFQYKLRLSIISCFSFLSPFACIFSFSPYPSNTTKIHYHYLISSFLLLFACIFSFSPLSFPIQLRLSFIILFSCLLPVSSHSLPNFSCIFILFLSILSLSFNTTKIIHYLIFPLFSPFAYYPLSHASSLIHFACIFSFSPLSFPIQLRLSIISLSYSFFSLTLCLYLLILSLILPIQINIIHYLISILLFLTICLYLLILSLILSNTTKIIHLSHASSFSFTFCLLSIISLFSFSLFACIFSFSLLILSNTTKIIHYLMPLFFLTLCLYLLISLLILSNTIKLYPLSHALSSHLLSYPFACIFSFSPYPFFQYNLYLYPLSHASYPFLTLFLYLLILILSYPFPIQLKLSIISCLFFFINHLPVSSHSLLIPSNTTKIIIISYFIFSHHLPCLLILSLILPIQLKLSIYLMPLSFSIRSFSCIFSFSPYPSNTTKIIHYLMPLLIFLTFAFYPLSHASLSSLTHFCLYLLILSLILSNTTKIIHYLMPSLFFTLCLYLLILSPLSFPIQLKLSIISHPLSFISHSPLCLYLLILSLIPSNTTKIIHYLMPLFFLFTLCLYLLILSLILPIPINFHYYPLSSLNHLPVSSHSPYPSNTTKNHPYLISIFPLPVSSHSLPYPSN
ncbi:unnamed protein product [Acanthosepion pharaonis]|uniref:Uncharacterized protein n=1 Tax=Acanthosepion pharaonis TaxID=158019 RepID=A0A812CBF9_ACAPH|nr:unnamed protein product [Sepia pharaonis]